MDDSRGQELEKPKLKSKAALDRTEFETVRLERSKLEAALDEAQRTSRQLEDELKKTEARHFPRLQEIERLKNELTKE
jgi:uncharacterized protein YhaN